MLSQTAERVYWFARYVERTENIARLMLVRHQLILDLPKNIQPDWSLLVDMLGIHEEFKATQKEATEKNIISFIFSDRSHQGSVISTIASARENMRTTREVLPSETWECVNALYLSVSKRSGMYLSRSSRHKVLNDIIMSCQQITGLLATTMNHGDAYQFIRLGSNLEQADMTTRIVDAGSASLSGAREEIEPYRNVLWISILRSLSAYQMYRLDTSQKVKPEAVLDFLLKSEVFPRSTAFNLAELESCVQRLDHHDKTLGVIKTISKRLRTVDLSALEGIKLHQYIDDLQAELGSIHGVIYSTWLHPETLHKT
ncbi:alpha-E domain-containing protein [Oceanicoccus sp. KOV_DT_Chl]|uniref:alpha-E domain-containing protein n=1 Tax=Oceanicoccus sp. KOV_DT_Chl TaxID=1904639 RepID=UPI000C79D8A2|nr:alpha-E domain-containing protein [Oceanicoccus sp. KOV_DT_Chl]